MRWCDAGARARAAGWVGGDALAKMSATAAPMKPKKGAVAGQSGSMEPGILQRCGRVLRREVPAREAGCALVPLWAGAGPPGGTVRRAAVRKRGSGSTSLY